MTKDETIDRLWEQSNHGTRREDVEAAYNAGAEAERKACAPIVEALVSHIEKKHHMNQHNPYTARELWPELFAMAAKYMRSNAGVTGAEPKAKRPR